MIGKALHFIMIGPTLCLKNSWFLLCIDGIFYRVEDDPTVRHSGWRMAPEFRVGNILNCIDKRVQ